MNGRRVAALCSALLLSHLGCIYAAEEVSEGEGIDTSDHEWITMTVNSLGMCSGYFEFMSDIYKSDKPATAAQFHNVANGARSAAAYLLYLEYNATHDKVKALGEFYHYPQGKGDVNHTQMAMYLENKDLDSIAAEGRRCMDLLPMQEDILQRLRNDAIDRQQSKP